MILVCSHVLLYGRWPFIGQDAYISLNSRMESDVKERDRDVIRLHEDLLEREAQVERLKVVRRVSTAPGQGGKQCK